MQVSSVQIYRGVLLDAVRSCNFYKEELLLLKIRMQEVSEKNAALMIVDNVEDFENECVAQDEAFDHIIHNLKLQINAVEKLLIAEHSTLQNSVSKQKALVTEVENAEKSFIDTKHGFYQFLSKVL